MTTLLYHHPICAEHDMGAGHPECPERLEVILNTLRKPPFAALEWREAPEATREQLTRAHPAAHVERIMAAVPKTGLRALDADTALSPRSGEAALRAAGAFCAAVDAVMQGEAKNAFCAVRPPGHHAEPNQAMGFCLFNNVAVGALHALEVYGLKRVAVIDFDVHHGNGTQAIFWDRPQCLYVSTHQSPLYPGTGRRNEHGSASNIVNVPLAPYSGSTQLQEAWVTLVDPELHAFRPDMIFISAGFDAHQLDPLAELEFIDEDYAWLTREILDVAAHCCEGRVVSGLEGGYSLAALTSGVAVHVQALLEA
ncbi:MAG: histone deacetylase family protein [Gammaproteobacteria bacterium]|nr:histone deacetylase family protein [Gammaproteobacteria bacterium]MCP5423694.1 histone deacetylase family protein [Gammaproteobacteria bacterium]